MHFQCIISHSHTALNGIHFSKPSFSDSSIFQMWWLLASGTAWDLDRKQICRHYKTLLEWCVFRCKQRKSCIIFVEKYQMSRDARDHFFPFFNSAQETTEQKISIASLIVIDDGQVQYNYRHYHHQYLTHGQDHVTVPCHITHIQPEKSWIARKSHHQL